MEVVRERRGRSPRSTGGVSKLPRAEVRTGQLTVHEDRLRDIIRIVAGDDVLDAQSRCASVQGLAAEHAAVGAVPLLAHLLDDLVHGPAVQLCVPQDSQGHVVLLRVPLDRLQTIISISFDALVDRQQHEVEPIVVALVQRLEHRGQHRRVLAARGSDRDALAALEEIRGDDGVVDFRLEDVDEARLAELRVVLWAQDQRAVGLAHGAYRGRHPGRVACRAALTTCDEGRRQVWRGESRNSAPESFVDMWYAPGMRSRVICLWAPLPGCSLGGKQIAFLLPSTHLQCYHIRQLQCVEEHGDCAMYSVCCLQLPTYKQC